MADRELYDCPTCLSQYTSPLAAANCCDPMWDNQERLGYN